MSRHDSSTEHEAHSEAMAEVVRTCEDVRTWLRCWVIELAFLCPLCPLSSWAAKPRVS